MPQIKIRVGGRLYELLCDAGQEAHVHGLAARLDTKLAPLSQSLPSAGEARQIVLAALLLADDVVKADSKLDAAREEMKALRNQLAQAQRRLEQQDIPPQKRDLLAKKSPLPPPSVTTSPDTQHKDEVLLAKAIDLLTGRIEAIADLLVKD